MAYPARSIATGSTRIARSTAGSAANTRTRQIKETFRIPHRQRAQQQRINNTEGRCTRADTQGERKDGRSRTDFGLQELAPAKDGVGRCQYIIVCVR